jgi:hypothetical protein
MAGTAGAGGVAGAAGGCSGSCDDGFNCTIDACQAGKCVHSIGPNTGATACPPGQYCTIEKGCVTSPVCATDQECKDAFKGDACKANARCDPKSSLCLFDILDKDHDQYPPQACGGTDCDDSDSQVHPGAWEDCDGKDNDCDGQVDDGATCLDPLYSCQAGSCKCEPENDCPSYGCVDTATDAKHCGGCGHACATTATCVAGKCVCAPQDQCNGACVDKSSDLKNCGTCGNACATGASCVNGGCVCPTGQTACGTKCTDTATDPQNCGVCGKACDPGQNCVAGTCVVPAGGACVWQPNKNPCTSGYWCRAPGCGSGGTCVPDVTMGCKAYGGGQLAPVCGCDGLTYWNGLGADCFRMAVASTGACAPGVSCGGVANTPCAKGSCNKHLTTEAACGGAVAGMCWALPEAAACFAYKSTMGARKCGDPPGKCTRTCDLVQQGAAYFEDSQCPPET